MTSALEPIGLARRIPLGEVMRWALIGLDEPTPVDRAHSICLASELVPFDAFWSRVDEHARIIAAKPSAAVQTIWQMMEVDRRSAQEVGWNSPLAGDPIGKSQVSRETFINPDWKLR